mmetsp:Transcript_19208/g.49973  ORF Transcript_19208/g.49973 Transcript_19208/m.49973 type:complete len:201 (+) Transcript_19208:29-631(+)
MYLLLGFINFVRGHVELPPGAIPRPRRRGGKPDRRRVGPLEGRRVGPAGAARAGEELVLGVPNFVEVLGREVPARTHVHVDEVQSSIARRRLRLAPQLLFCENDRVLGRAELGPLGPRPRRGDQHVRRVRDVLADLGEPPLEHGEARLLFYWCSGREGHMPCRLSCGSHSAAPALVPRRTAGLHAAGLLRSLVAVLRSPN